MLSEEVFGIYNKLKAEEVLFQIGKCVQEIFNIFNKKKICEFIYEGLRLSIWLLDILQIV